MLEASTIAAFATGEPQAVRAVYQAYGALVYGVAHRVLGDTGLAEEAAQQAFVQAWRAAGTFDPARELGPWLATITRRVAIDVYRREARRPRQSLDAVPAGDPSLATAAASLDEVWEAWEVRAAVESLPADERTLMRLQHFDGLTQAEIAERLRIPLGTVKSRSHRAHGRLAEQLGFLRRDLG